MSIRELRASLPSINEELDAAGEIIVTRHGKAVARLVPIKPSRPTPSHADLRASMPRMEVPSAELVRAERDGDRDPLPRRTGCR